MGTAVCAQQTNLSARFEILWVSCINLFSCHLSCAHFHHLRLNFCLFEKFPKVTLLWLCCQLTGICLLGGTAISKSVGTYASFWWSLKALSPSVPSGLLKSSLCLCGGTDGTWGIEEFVCWLAANEMGLILCWEAHGPANKQPGAGWVKHAVGKVATAQRLQCSFYYSYRWAISGVYLLAGRHWVTSYKW